MEIKISPKDIVRFMGSIYLVLLFLTIAANIARYFFGYRTNIVSAFNFGSERNFPTFYSAAGLMLCAVLAAVIAAWFKRNKRKYTGHWIALSAIFAYLSLDEMLEIHEQATPIVRSFIHTGGLLYFAWIIPFGILTILFALTYLGFLRDLPKKSRRLFILSGAIYVMGAIGIEAISTPWYAVHGWDNFGYALWQTMEESFEMWGIILFAYSIASYIKDQIKSVTIRLGDQD